MFFEIHMGLQKPKTLDEQLKVQADINAMQQAIEFGRRDSHIINACLQQAEYNGFSGEDKYAILAYHALIALETHYQQAVKFLNLMPAPPVVVPASQPNECHT